MLGQKQRAVLLVVSTRGYCTIQDITEIYNIRKYEQSIDKIKEFIALGWIRKHPNVTINKLLMGDKFPYEELEK